MAQNRAQNTRGLRVIPPPPPILQNSPFDFFFFFFFFFLSMAMANRSFLPSMAQLWNSLCAQISAIRSRASFSREVKGCFTIRVHHLSHFWWKMKCFVIPQHAFFCVMNKPYIDYIKLLTYRHNLSWIQLK